MKHMVKSPKSRFLRLMCPKCKSEQVIFGSAASKVKCLKCGTVLVEPTGGKSRIKSKVLEVLE
jgi:small subunit ribosomal protein S27e